MDTTTTAKDALPTPLARATAPQRGQGDCCPPNEQASCCEPSEKASCCGTEPTTTPGGCGCR